MALIVAVLAVGFIAVALPAQDSDAYKHSERCNKVVDKHVAAGGAHGAAAEAKRSSLCG